MTWYINLVRIQFSLLKKNHWIFILVVSFTQNIVTRHSDYEGIYIKNMKRWVKGYYKHRSKIIHKYIFSMCSMKNLATLIHFEYLQTIPNLLRTLATEWIVSPFSHFNQTFQHEFMHLILGTISSEIIHKSPMSYGRESKI